MILRKVAIKVDCLDEMESHFHFIFIRDLCVSISVATLSFRNTFIELFELFVSFLNINWTLKLFLKYLLLKENMI